MLHKKQFTAVARVNGRGMVPGGHDLLFMIAPSFTRGEMNMTPQTRVAKDASWFWEAGGAKRRPVALDSCVDLFPFLSFLTFIPPRKHVKPSPRMVAPTVKWVRTVDGRSILVQRDGPGFEEGLRST